MKNPEKKEENKKAGKKKEAQKGDALTGISEQLERAFNKKMKALVKEVKRETKKEIKEVTKDARQRIKAGAAEIMDNLLKNARAEFENIKPPGQEQAGMAAEPEDITLPETADHAPSATIPAISTTKKATTRSKRTSNAPEDTPQPETRTRTRKPRAARTGTKDATSPD